jgi:iron-regulated transporter 1
MWEMSIVLLTAQLTNNALTLVALSGFLSALSLFLFMPSIGSWLDRTNRMSVVLIALFSKLFFLTSTYVLCAILLMGSGSTSTAVTSSFMYIIPILYACASLSFNAITQSIEKDWLVVLSAGNSSWLTATNSVMSQIDLAAAALGPVVTGIIMSILTASESSFFFLCSNAVVTGFLFYFMKNLYESWPALSVRLAKPCVQVVPSTSRTSNQQYRQLYTSDDAAISAENGMPSDEPLSQQSLLIRCIGYLSLTEFTTSGCAGVMVSYAFLYATVLSFGSLMMVYLRWSGLPNHWIGIARGIASVLGFLGAYMFPSVKKSVGIRKAGLFSIWYQCSMVCVAALSFLLLGKFSAMVAVVVLTVRFYQCWYNIVII